MATLPYVTAPGGITKAVDNIKSASTPDKVSGDFVKEILKVKGGTGDQITSYLKKIGLADSSGKPTELYNKVRNPSTSGAAIAQAIRTAYKPLFDRNEYANTLSDDELKGLIVEETGLAHDSNPVKMTFAPFKALKAFAEFDEVLEKPVDEEPRERKVIHEPQVPNVPSGQSQPRLNIGYNIHLNLPATDDIAVFNAIFKSLKENLLIDE